MTALLAYDSLICPGEHRKFPGFKEALPLFESSHLYLGRKELHVPALLPDPEYL